MPAPPALEGNFFDAASAAAAARWTPEMQVSATRRTSSIAIVTVPLPKRLNPPALNSPLPAIARNLEAEATEHTLVMNSLMNSCACNFRWKQPRVLHKIPSLEHNRTRASVGEHAQLQAERKLVHAGSVINQHGPEESGACLGPSEGSIVSAER